MIFRKNCSNTIVNWWFSWKSARHPWMKARKRWKLLVIHGWKRENDEKRSSSMDENEKTMKSARHPWMKMKKRWKSAFDRGLDFGQRGAKLNGFSNYLTMRFHADCKGLCCKATFSHISLSWWLRPPWPDNDSCHNSHGSQWSGRRVSSHRRTAGRKYAEVCLNHPDWSAPADSLGR